MHTACIGNAKRHGGWHGDDMWPSYTNVSAAGVRELTSSHGSCAVSAAPTLAT
jgi:hypothetical protein